MAHEVPRRAASAGPVRVFANTLPKFFLPALTNESILCCMPAAAVVRTGACNMHRDSSAWIALSGAWVHARPAVALQGRRARWLVRPGTSLAQTMLYAASWLRYALAICRPACLACQLLRHSIMRHA